LTVKKKQPPSTNRRKKGKDVWMGGHSETVFRRKKVGRPGKERNGKKTREKSTNKEKTSCTRSGVKGYNHSVGELKKVWGGVEGTHPYQVVGRKRRLQRGLKAGGANRLPTRGKERALGPRE